MKKPTGYVIYEGSSLLNGEPIVAILTLKSANVKTGDVATVWYLHQNINPIEAKQTGADKAICGSCPHMKGSCYVQVYQAPNNIFKSYKKGIYPKEKPENLVGMFSSIRFGGYGDSASVPTPVNKSLITDNLKTVLGYTHQWKSKTFDPENLDFCQASVDTLKDVELFKRKFPNKFYFRVTRNIDKALPINEVVCKNVVDPTIKCNTCGICNGNKANVVVPVHGATSIINVFKNNFKEDK